MSLQGGLFQQGDAQTGLAGAGHAGDDGVAGQVGGVVEQGLVEGFTIGGIEEAAEVEFFSGMGDSWEFFRYGAVQ